MDRVSPAYARYLKTPWWMVFRHIVRKVRRGRCQKCGSKIGLNVHHLRYYRNGRSILYRERLSDVQLLCRKCHRLVHNIK